MSTRLSILDGAASVGTRVFGGFASLLAPLPQERFFSDYWERAPLLIKRNQAAYFDSLLALADVDRLVGSQVLGEHDVRIAQDGTIRPFSEFARHGCADRSKLLDAYRNGATLVFEHLNRHHAALGRLLAQCEAELQLPFRANSYLTPAQSRGFSLHYDTHDVLILQVTGSKCWQIYDDPVALPTEEQRFQRDCLAQANMLAEIMLEPGDVLYLPRGYIHGATANAATSLHITIGMRSHLLQEMTETGMRRALRADPQMRRGVRYNAAPDAQSLERLRRHLHAIVDGLDIGDAAEAALGIIAHKRMRPLDGLLLAAQQARTLLPDTQLQLRGDALHHLFRRGTGLALVADGVTTPLSAAAAQAAASLAPGQPFCARQLPGLDANEQLELVRTLYCRGFLMLSPPTGSITALAA